MANVLVLGGCGAMGTATTRDLAETSDFAEIVVADVNLEAASRLCNELGGGRLKPLAVDVTDKAGLVQLFGKFDVVINCTSYKFGLAITEAAIEAKKPMLDLGGLYNTPLQLEMTGKAEAAGVTIVLGCGATPGVTNLMAKRGSEHMDQVDEIHVAFATYRAIAPSPGLLDTVMDEFSPGIKRFYYENGEFIDVPPLTGAKQIKFCEPVGLTTAYFVPHSETRTLPRFIPGVKRVDVRGCWRPETMQMLQMFKDLELLDHESAGGGQQAPKAFLREYFLNRAWAQTDDKEWAFLLNVEVEGRKGNATVKATYNLSHPPKSEWGTSCTSRVTGIPASIGAQLIAKGQAVRPGVISCEAAFEPLGFFAELEKRKMFVHEEVVIQQTLSQPQGVLLGR
jgi:saccharopine dehydrogenase (NAD+, L-lysine-forming)